MVQDGLESVGVWKPGFSLGFGVGWRIRARNDASEDHRGLTRLDCTWSVAKLGYMVAKLRKGLGGDVMGKHPERGSGSDP